MKQIYLLEDSPIVSELLKFVLIKEFNCQVTIFENGPDLFDNIHSSPDVIILDYFIDNEFNENGLAIFKKIKNINKSIPAIIFSGQHDLELVMDFLNNGADSYIDKNKESFLDDIINAVDKVFKANKPDQTSSIKNNKTYKMEVFGLGFFFLLYFFSLFSV